MGKTLEQKRAEYSYECVNSIKDLELAEKFKSLVKKAPTLILTNGFGNTMAFLFSKGNPEHLMLAYIIGRYLFEENEYTKNIFGEKDIYKGNRNDFFDFYKKLNELKKIQDEYRNLIKSKKNKEGENKKNEFNELFRKLRDNYNRYLNYNLKEKSIDEFNIQAYFQFLSLELQDSIFRNLVFTETYKYILTTEETLRFLNWLKRFVDAMIEDKKGNEG
ncbi:hypothetical protein JCM14244_07860 [Venenivibrio stagnispumantis]|uniref:CRISPR type III-B/RAMP module-associated protein Cmr5 n=1 Tax=Venenivibrio stagnispumantis TaxID=407998 RepID=A0AA45WNR0_9AQUI|nr:type III-B CRISPR module-associated protein Cmr5 [Venenivibrio stagnispumantis]MCW4573975.1 type III-B CRISPR module-associated protein Cmr5 [Venenivibrio stagnispumantis]SMP19169.1 CRISPR type III-B/RAMP module-associated protein Cmr5 [Venenivibrio stagnispumantis]